MASVAGLLALGISFIFACLNVCGNIPIERARLRSLTNLSIASGGRCCSTFLFMFVWPGVLFFTCFIMVVTSQWVIFLVSGLSGDRLLRLVVVYGSISVRCVLMKLFTRVSVV